jgi:hypothetical protein
MGVHIFRVSVGVVDLQYRMIEDSYLPCVGEGVGEPV